MVVGVWEGAHRQWEGKLGAYTPYMRSAEPFTFWPCRAYQMLTKGAGGYSLRGLSIRKFLFEMPDPLRAAE
jgi:hypothetical protein